MDVKIRPFEEPDIPYKVIWINDIENNRYLHYDLPLTESKTRVWYEKLKEKTDRFDCTIEIGGVPVGLIGLLNIDNTNKKAEYYICIGDNKFKNKGIAVSASGLLINESFKRYSLNRIYLFTEVENIGAQKLFEKIGFIKEGLLKEDLIYCGRKIDRYIYGLKVEEYINKHEMDNL